MQPPGVGVQELGQGVDVGGLHLGEVPVVQNALRQLVLHCQVFQHRHVGRIAGLGLLAGRQFQLLEQDALQLRRRIDV